YTGAAMTKISHGRQSRIAVIRSAEQNQVRPRKTSRRQRVWTAPLPRRRRRSPHEAVEGTRATTAAGKRGPPVPTREAGGFYGLTIFDTPLLTPMYSSPYTSSPKVRSEPGPANGVMLQAPSFCTAHQIGVPQKSPNRYLPYRNGTCVPRYAKPPVIEQPELWSYSRIGGTRLAHDGSGIGQSLVLQVTPHRLPSMIFQP